MDGKGKGKGPGTKSGDGPAAGPAGPVGSTGPKGGKGKGGRGKGQTLTKPEISPTKAMKPLWWRRLLLGADIKSGAIWEKVSDQTSLLPTEKIEARFSKVQAAKPAQAETETAQAAQVIRISAVHERELRLLPPPDEVGRSLMDLDDRLALDELERVQLLAPSAKDLEALRQAQQNQPDASVGRMEEYWLAISEVPALCERMACWHFIRTYRERVSCHSEHLQDLDDMFSSIQCEALPALFGSILSTGNWLNSGTENGDAVAFDLELLQQLHDIKGSDNSLQHLIFRDFFDSLNSQAAELLEAFSPILQNVSRKVVKDNDGVRISKSVHVTLEDCDEAISSLQAEYLKIKETLGECLGPLDSTDPVKLRLEREFQAASLAIDDVAQRCDALKLKYEELLKWLQTTGIRSSEFCLMWDNFLLPGDLLLDRYQELHNNNTFEAVFCQGETFLLEDFQALWQLEEPHCRTFSAEEGDPPFQRQRSRSPAEPQDSPLSAQCSPSRRKEHAPLIPLPWRKLEVSSGPSVWNAVEAHAAPSAPPAELQSRFSVHAVAEAEKRRVAKEAKSRFEESAKESEQRWVALACQLPKVEDLLQLLQEPSGTSPWQCTPDQLQQVKKMLLEEASEAPEEVNYRNQLGALQGFQERLSLAAFLMSYRQIASSCSESLEELLDIAQCFQYSEALPDFLAVVLASGNYLNGGTQRGQADGFDVSELEKLQGVQDAEGKDLRHFILEVLCQQMPLQAEQLFRELRPCFLNVRRAISKDAVGTAKLTKTVVHVLETVDEEVTEMQCSLVKAQDALSMLPDAQNVKKDLEQASVLVNELVAVRDSAKAAFEKLFSFLAMKPMRTLEFCLLWDNFFMPEDLMVNKGKDDYFIPAFCRQEPFKLEHIQVLWRIEGGQNGDLEDREENAMEGPLDAEQFCAALVPLVQSPEDFANNAASFSACPGTKSNGGDLGEVERGQMHPAIEAALFDPELELGVPLGPVQTDAGYHLLMARKKCRGILSTTVSASHILVKHGRYRPPACEASIHLPNLVGEEGDVTRTWRRWSFAHSLPPALTHLAEAQEEAEQLQQKRRALDRQAGLRLLFRWEGAFVFNVKGILSDISGDMIGPINLVDGSTDTQPKQLGDLLTTDDARTLHPEKDGFDGRLRWMDNGWQDADGLLDAESMCTVQILLRRFDADAATRKTCHSVRLRIKPTRLAYATSEQGLRLGLSSPLKVQDRSATLVKQLDTGEILVKVDNGQEEIVDARPRTVVGSNQIQRIPGSEILLLHDGEHLVHAKVLEVFDRKHGNRHRVACHGADGAEQNVEVDLNEMNHSSQRFNSAEEFEEARALYCRKITQEGRYIEDAITGNRVDISEQIVRIEMEVKQQPNVDALRHMAFDDLEWVSDSSFRLGDRVWAQGREGVVEHLQKHGRYMVKFSDGTSSPALHASSIKRAQAIAGVQHRDFAEVRDIAGVVPLLLHPSRFLQGRLHGAHSSQPILIRAGPGTGKTWSMQQLLFLLAQELSISRTEIQLQLVPLLIPIQKLARMLRQHAANSKEGPPSNLVLFYIQAEFPSGDTRSMLEQAFEMRSLIVMLDGIDEAASMKLAVEDYVTKTLVPMGVPLLVTSRPEGIRKRLYSRDFVIMNLKPLSQDQQHKIIEKQLQQNEFFKHLMALSAARKDQEEIFNSNFSPENLQELQSLLAKEPAAESAPSSMSETDHDVLAAVFFCLAVRLLAVAALDQSALQLPLEGHSASAESQNMSRRLSLHSKKTGVIRSDFVCPTASSFSKVLELLLSGFSTYVDGEEAKLQVTACDSSHFNDPGPLRFRWVSCRLSLLYQQSSHPVQVQIHHGQSLETFRRAGVQEHFSFVQKTLKDGHQAGDEPSFDAMLEARMRVFEEICRVPVLLSVLACAFAVEVQHLPADIYELYEMGMLATLQRQLGKDQVPVGLEMLEAIAVANHLAKRRTFQVEDLEDALKGTPHLPPLWSRLLEDGSIPLVKILTLGHSIGEFQFSHLSFQEALFVRALKSGLRNNFWSRDSVLSCNLNDPFYRNAFAIGRNHLGEALAVSRPCLNFDCHPRLTDIGRTGLRNLLAGVRAIRELDLANVNLQNDQEVDELISAMTSAKVPNLKVLGLSRCRLNQKSTRAIGALLQMCPLKRLDLEGNTAFLVSNEAVEGLTEAVGRTGLQSLDVLSLRWCHIQPVVSAAVKDFLDTCCGRSVILDIQGNRGLSKDLLQDFKMLKGC